MPGRHQLIYAYRNYEGGTDLWCSDGWSPEGQWFYVWNTAKPVALWHTTFPRRWKPMGWRFVPSNWMAWRYYSDFHLSPEEATQWAALVPRLDNRTKGFSKGACHVIREVEGELEDAAN